MTDPNDVTALGQTIQLAIAPVFLLVAAGGFLNVLAGRLHRIVDRARTRGPLLLEASGHQHETIKEELRSIDRRIGLVNAAIGLVVLAAVLICLVVILMFAAQMSDVALSGPIAILFALAMFSIAAGIALFLVETRIASRWIHVSSDLLEHRVMEEQRRD
ncbi:DUF2721 domain-containing protein [Sphingomicrobium astaxanthinifaciens]|uniref:DUF2721 domain-containing protein n=1 Tax=Sphingomicrobium astaxanthinifaciens TaxID=1227949 RepID=UPI001FCCBE90|nr:DUF2721 domain-containing protein [Sphingomicrobium astaxanthinifaciens]MCJ7420857.1 DUF2721 domain-containing protein [Sphingomicrobium astaxanthinifaciens]